VIPRWRGLRALTRPGASAFRANRSLQTRVTMMRLRSFVAKASPWSLWIRLFGVRIPDRFILSSPRFENCEGR
jgi:hypothetical protein